MRWVLLLLLVASPASAEDGDGDGIADADDKCPTEPETKNQYQDEDGCPDQLVRITCCRDPVREYVQFRKGSARPRRASAILDEVAKTMAAHPELTLVAVVGHASADERRADELGQRRAEAVVEALVARGVERERLMTLSEGAGKPLAHGKHDPRNRRVEFNIVRRLTSDPPDTPAPPPPQ
jgi:OOP family OmpA-OmpF porin